MSSAERPDRRRTRVRPGVAAASLALLAGVVVAVPVASAEIVRVTSTPSRSTETELPDAVAISTFSATAAGTPIAGLPVTGLPDELATLEARPGSGPVAYAGDAPDGPRDPDALDEPLRRAQAGLLPIGGGPAQPFGGASGEPLGFRYRPYGNRSNDEPPPWITWAPDGASVVLHAFGRDQRRDAWLGPPGSRRCDVATARCDAVAGVDVVDLTGGGTVEVEAGLTAPIGASRSTGRDSDEGRATTRRFRPRVGRRFAVTVRVAGRPGIPATWSTSGRLRRGAPAYDRSYPSAAGVLVRTSTVAAPKRAFRSRNEGIGADAGRAAIVRRDGSILPIGRLYPDVVGTLPDGRWILTGGAPATRKSFRVSPIGEPLRTLDPDGRIAPILSGSRPVSPIWAASAAGLRDSLATTTRIRRAGVDSTTGLLVLVVRFQDDGDGDHVITVPLDGSAPPRFLGEVPGRRTTSEERHLVR